MNSPLDNKVGCFMVLLLVLAPWFLGCSSDDGTSMDSTNWKYSQTLSFGPQGGTLELDTPEGVFRLAIPAEALGG